MAKSRTTTEVTRDTKKIMGVDTVVVHDTVTLDGKPSEDTFDWYAQDRDGNVWYFGEATKEFTDGKVDTSGSFEAGVDGAFPGIVMPAHPHVGDKYRQEFAKGVAEDTGEVLSLNSSETAPLTGAGDNLLKIADSDLLDPTAPAENKYELTPAPPASSPSSSWDLRTRSTSALRYSNSMSVYSSCRYARRYGLGQRDAAHRHEGPHHGGDGAEIRPRHRDAPAAGRIRR